MCSARHQVWGSASRPGTALIVLGERGKVKDRNCPGVLRCGDRGCHSQPNLLWKGEGLQWGLVSRMVILLEASQPSSVCRMEVFSKAVSEPNLQCLSSQHAAHGGGRPSESDSSAHSFGEELPMLPWGHGNCLRETSQEATPPLPSLAYSDLLESTCINSETGKDSSRAGERKLLEDFSLPSYLPPLCAAPGSIGNSKRQAEL